MNDFGGERWQRYYPSCQCSQESAGVELVRVQDSLGRECPVFRCCTCGRAAGNKPIKRGLLNPRLVIGAPLLKSNFDVSELMECELCGTAPAQLHHWAPRALFGYLEADQWPQSWLCQPCHSYWHRVVTPGLKVAGDLKCRVCGGEGVMRRPTFDGPEAPLCWQCLRGGDEEIA